MYQRRSYREMIRKSELVWFQICVEETDLYIGACSDLTKNALKLVRKQRELLKKYILENSIFETSLVPIEIKEDAPKIVKIMAKAGKIANTGPMAAVAGAIAQTVGEKLLEFSPKIFVENGGDIFLLNNIDQTIAVYAGDSPLSMKIGIRIGKGQMPIGVCTSSGTVGHSLSFGKADGVVIISKDTALADAVATYAGNLVKTINDIDKALEYIKSIDGVLGGLIIIKDKMGVWGEIEITKI